jgi:hypothetical protein
MMQKWFKFVTALVFAAIVVGGMMMGLGAAAEGPSADTGAELVRDTVQTGTSAISLTVVEIQDDVQVPDVKRLGINVGSRSQWGAAQFLKNIINNPGFEPGVYGSVAHVAEGSGGQRIVQDFWDTSWNNDQYGIGQPEGFWNGADYEIVYGPAEGRSGTITNFTHENDRYTFYLDSDGTVPDQWDVMFVRREWDGMAGITDWAIPDATTTRPDSPGEQSLHLLFPDEAWRAPYVFYMDSSWRDGDRSSGKLFIIQGNWHLEFWAKGGKDGDQLRARFFREGEADFVDETVTLTTEWQKYEFDVFVPAGTDPVGPYGPDDYHPLLGFGFYFLYGEEDDTAWVDDVALYSADHTNPTVFTDAYVDRLKELRPGVLRNWSNQFGSTLDVQLAAPWARKTQGYRPHERVPGAYGYSLHEFLELCHEVGAEPWYVIPPTFSPEDMDGLVEYLAAPADGTHPYADHRAALGQAAPWTEVFPTIHLEFGNELWGAASGGDPFMGASLLGGTRLGQIAHDRFAVLMDNPYYDADRINLIIGGQAGYPGRQGEIDSNSFNHDTIALAPYFGVLDEYGSDDEIYYPLFARPFDDVGAGRVRESWDYMLGVGQGTGLAVYELNFHTTNPDDGASIDVRNDYVAGAGGAIALPLHMLVYLRDLQIRDQCAFSSLQYAYRMSNDEYVRLWGMLRDLEATGRKRPTWLGVELANRAVQGDMLVTVQGGDNPSWHQSVSNGVENEIDVNYVQSFAFRDGERYSVVLFNLHLDEAQRVQLALPAPPKRQATLYQIAPSSIHADNEDAEEVTIQAQALDDLSDFYELDLPAHSVTALTWEVVTLELTGTPADRAIRLNWTVNVTLPSTHTWQINYSSETGTVLFPPISIPTSTVRSHTVTGLTNYVWYTVTLNAMLDASPILTDTVHVMPTDIQVYLPLVLK